MGKLINVKKFLERQNPVKIKQSKSTNSNYYYFDSCTIRVSDHLDTKLNFSYNLLNITNSTNNNEFVLSINGQTLVKDYSELKKLLIAYLTFIKVISNDFFNFKFCYSYKEEYQESLKIIEGLTEKYRKDLDIITLEVTNKNNEINNLKEQLKTSSRVLQEVSELSSKKAEALIIANNTAKNIKEKYNQLLKNVSDSEKMVTELTEANNKFNSKLEDKQVEIDLLNEELNNYKEKLNNILNLLKK